MRHKRRTFHLPKGFKYVLIALFIAVGLLIGGAWYWNTHKQSIIRDKIESAIEEGSNGLYKVQYDSLALDEVAGSLSIHNLQLRFDSSIYASSLQSQYIPPVLVNVHIPEIHVSGIQTPRALLEKEIKGKRMEIRNPVIEMFYTYKGKDSARNVPTTQVYEQLLGKLKMIELDSLIITGAQLKTRNLRTGETIVAANNIAIVLSQIKIDSTAAADSTRLFFSKHLSVSVKEVKWSSPNGLYNYNLSNSLVHSSAREIQISKFSIDPVLPEDAFVRRIGTQDDRYDFSFQNIRLCNVDVQKLMNEEINADTLFVPSPSFKVYRDLARPRDNKNRVGHYPHQVLEDIPMSISIKNVLVSNAYVEYKERNPITRESGKVRFYNVNANVNNFSNNRNKLSTNRIMTANVSSSFLNSAALNTQWIFYLQNHQGRFGVKGSLGTVDASLLNQLAEPMGPARFEKGKVNRLEFDLVGNNYVMNGKVKVLYNDLKLSLMEKDKGAKETDRKFLASFLANMVIKNDNPKGDDPARESTVSYKRDPNRSIFNLCWKSIFTGVKETLGVKK
jgi:hypothetical protein